jgi:RNA polymerase sigma-70 factor (ECF subfamily)
MGTPSAVAGDDRSSFLDFYEHALPQVYGYLATRCGPVAVAEDLTAETFLAAVDATRRPDPPAITVPWIIGVARHKLVDHWRRQARDERRLRVLADDSPGSADPWDARLDAVQVRDILDGLTAPHRAALTLRYLDDLSVPEVAVLLERTVHATEALLVRARTAFRRAYGEEEHDA